MESTTSSREAAERAYVLPSSREGFIQERKYLHNVTPATLDWYHQSFLSFRECETLGEVRRRIVELRERGTSPVSINCWLRCIKAYFRWQKKEWDVPRLKEEKKVLATLSPVQISELVGYNR